MQKFSFWQKWLFFVGLIISIFGLALALFNQMPFFDVLFNQQINPAFWIGGQVTPEGIRFQGWIYGVLGATITGWGICVTFLAHFPFRNREQWSWNAIALGVMVWFITDTALSLRYRVVFNVVFNTILLTALWLPLAFTRRQFISSRTVDKVKTTPIGKQL